MLDPIHVYWTVGEQILLDARRVTEIPKVTATLRFQSGRIYEHTGALNFLDNRVDPTTGTQELRAQFPNPDKLLLPGQYVKVVVTVGEEQSALLIP
jgi:membrane fusion protein (multidrug efflux system)